MRSCTLAFLALLAAGSAHAVTLVPMTLDDIVRGADVALYGRVARVEGRWTADRRRIESLVTLDVVETLKGAARERLRFALPGGQAGDRVQVIPGAPALREGDLVVVFLASEGPALPRPVGWTQGVLPVTPDVRTGAPLVSAPLRGEPGSRVTRGSAARAPVTVAALTALVRAIDGDAR
ncbi:MAG: hypothetical protein AB1635_15575 [Acidobacteriota bacterium]